ncbi:sorting nexin-16-like isoform X2 [Dreissena polymorpha]|uniref:PX domain-containing protein n=2 Tax=Dreissena polymorpha TaxID=45954 RepID=A0A9D4E8L4_DREPO|nr:sorting nexin-16-like isoform X2 [Dreissena polymorpha]XP_052232508.1 sorting nexin-16-like isoform X2 [Dreissena polymorpha]KAH3774505.1 hypothetical protein DPMN_175887 [Dreissena polymorpha]
MTDVPTESDTLLSRPESDEECQVPVSIPRETKLSLSQYQTTRSLSTSGEVIPSPSHEQTTCPLPTTREITADIVVHNVSNNNSPSQGGPKTSTPKPTASTRSSSHIGNVDIESYTGAVGFSPVRRRGTESVGGSFTSTYSTTDRPSRSKKTVSFVDPLNLRVPVVGFEVMDQRSKFTVFKLHVHKTETDNWFVFRRYTDFEQLQRKLRRLFPMFRLALPPKRWFRDNYEKDFLEDRMLGLQAFIDSVLCHSDLCNSVPVQEFFCFCDPPGPHDSVEESRAYCEELEDSVYSLRKQLGDRDTEIELLKEELVLYKNQVEILTKALRDATASGSNTSPMNPSPVSSLAECDFTAAESGQSAAAKKVRTTNQSAFNLKPTSSEMSIQEELVAASKQSNMEVLQDKRNFKILPAS